MRLNLITWAPEVVRRAKVLHEAELREVRGKKHTYYEITAGVGKGAALNVVIIVRQIGDGLLHFYSIRYGKKLNSKKQA